VNHSTPIKAVILAGGLGSRISEETHLKPKPMIEIGGKPLLWHVMKLYAAHGISDFIICCGYRGYVIKEYFANYFLHMSDVTFDMTSNSMQVHHGKAEPWKVTVVDTGEDTMTGGRLGQVGRYVSEGTFCLTYGDGLSDVDIQCLVDDHRKSGRKATLTAVQPPGRFGQLELMENRVEGFCEKPVGDGGWINGGFFVLEPSVLQLISGDDCVWEREPLEQLAREDQLNAFKHRGFWHAMDTLRDKMHLEKLWETGNAPWKKW
jgi:glucose-1-phosphate cytidylyltransferase